MEQLMGIGEGYLAEHGLLTPAAAAELLGTTTKYVRSLIDRGRLKHVRILNRRLLRRSDLEAYRRDHPHLGNRTVAPAP